MFIDDKNFSSYILLIIIIRISIIIDKTYLEEEEEEAKQQFDFISIEFFFLPSKEFSSLLLSYHELIKNKIRLVCFVLL